MDETKCKKNEIEQIADSFNKSNYSIAAVGWRGLDQDEFIELLHIIRECPPDQILGKLNHLYKYAQGTIALDKSMSENCPDYIEGLCKCYLPDANLDEVCWRIKEREADNQRDRNKQEYQDWRIAVFERDGYTCQKCYKVGGDLNAHHIKSWANFKDLRFDINNGVTLCSDCHKKVHRKRGDEIA